jgi:hypothetical protein
MVSASKTGVFVKILFVLAFISSSIALAAIDSRIYGSWHLDHPVYEDQNMAVSITFELKPDAMLLTATCAYTDGDKLSATVQTHTQYTESSIHTVEEKHATVGQNGGKNCSVSVKPGTVNYQITNDKTMVMTDPASGQSTIIYKN